MRDWKRYYKQEFAFVKKTLKNQLHRTPDKQDYKRIEIVKKLNTNLISIYFDGEFIKNVLLIPEKL